MELLVADIGIEVERKMVHGMRLVVRPDGRVHLSMPFFMSERDARAFVLQHWNWILRTREKMKNRPQPTLSEYISGEKHYFFGKAYELVVETVPSGSNEVTLQGEQIVMRCRESTSRENRRNLLYAWYRRQLQAVLTELVDRWTQRLGTPEVTWSIRLMRSEWGSCMARKRRVVFNLDLARVPMECVEYVVVHELTHLNVQNHGPQFKALMTERMPEWKELRKRLKEMQKMQ